MLHNATKIFRDNSNGSKEPDMKEKLRHFVFILSIESKTIVITVVVFVDFVSNCSYVFIYFSHIHFVVKKKPKFFLNKIDRQTKIASFYLIRCVLFTRVIHLYLLHHGCMISTCYLTKKIHIEFPNKCWIFRILINMALTDGRTDRRTDGRADTLSYRNTKTRVKHKFSTWLKFIVFLSTQLFCPFCFCFDLFCFFFPPISRGSGISPTDLWIGVSLNWRIIHY